MLQTLSHSPSLKIISKLIFFYSVKMIVNDDCYIKISLYLDDDHNIYYFRIRKTILDILPEEKKYCSCTCIIR